MKALFFVHCPWLFALLVALVACSASQDQPAPVVTAGDSQIIVPTDPPQVDMPNPASAYCEQSGYKLEIRTAPDGSQSGVCIFPDGSECDEWAYFRGECKPGSSLIPPSTTKVPAQVEPDPAVPEEFASDGCMVYHNTALGYSFHYPIGTTLQMFEDPIAGISIVGSVVDGETWPSISIRARKMTSR